MAVFLSVKELLSGAESAGLELWEYVLRASADETGISTEHSWAQMAARLEAMKKADASYDAGMRSHSGLTGGDGAKMDAYAANGGGICGEFIDGHSWPRRCVWASATPGMHCIVAAPTAGACGVLPAVLLPYGRRYELPEDALIKALYVASGFGAVIAQRASISGAEAGCQAEIGTAAAMAAAALVYLHGGSAVQMANAAAMALKNMMGLVCDPVAGLGRSAVHKAQCRGRDERAVRRRDGAGGDRIAYTAGRGHRRDGSGRRGAPLLTARNGHGRHCPASPTAVKFREEFFGQ